MEIIDSNAIVKRKTTSKGRQKIEIKKIEKLSSRQVTFTKRRKGIFNKAAELCILTGAEIAVIVQSHGKKIFTFGHRDVDSVADRFLYGRCTDTESGRCWWDAEVCGMELEELERYAAAMDDLMTNVVARADDLLLQRVGDGDGDGCGWESSVGQDDEFPVWLSEYMM